MGHIGLLCQDQSADCLMAMTHQVSISSAQTPNSLGLNWPLASFPPLCLPPTVPIYTATSVPGTLYLSFHVFPLLDHKPCEYTKYLLCDISTEH